MAAGRKPKPVALHLIEGTYNVTKHRKLLENQPKPVGNLTDSPAWFTAEQKEVWRYGLENAPAGLLRRIDLSTYMAWCIAFDTYRLAVEQLNRWGSERLSIYTARGLIQNPMVEVMNRQALVMLKHSAEMGFTPSSRSRVSVEQTKEVNPFDEFA